jgi:hypothetical protein
MLSNIMLRTLAAPARLPSASLVALYSTGEAKPPACHLITMHMPPPGWPTFQGHAPAAEHNAVAAVADLADNPSILEKARETVGESYYQLLVAVVCGSSCQSVHAFKRHPRLPLILAGVALPSLCCSFPSVCMLWGLTCLTQALAAKTSALTHLPHLCSAWAVFTCVALHCIDAHLSLSPCCAAAAPAAPPAVVRPAGKVVEKAGEMFEETGAVGKQFTPHGAAGNP